MRRALGGKAPVERSACASLEHCPLPAASDAGWRALVTSRPAQHAPPDTGDHAGAPKAPGPHRSDLLDGLRAWRDGLGRRGRLAARCVAATHAPAGRAVPARRGRRVGAPGRARRLGWRRPPSSLRGRWAGRRRALPQAPGRRRAFPHDLRGVVQVLRDQSLEDGFEPRPTNEVEAGTRQR